MTNYDEILDCPDCEDDCDDLWDCDECADGVGCGTVCDKHSEN